MKQKESDSLEASHKVEQPLFLVQKRKEKELLQVVKELEESEKVVTTD